MIFDEEWLAELRIEWPEGCRIEGANVGGSWVVLKMVAQDGKAWALRIPKRPFTFANYIREVPNWLALTPQYDVDRLNRKLSNCLGDPQMYVVVNAYRDLFRSFIASFHEAGISDLDSLRGETQESTRAIRFIIQTPAFAYLLDDWASEAQDPERQSWAARARESRARLGAGDSELLPEILLDNPLFVWGGAILSGFFTKSEFPRAASAVRHHFDAVREEWRRAFIGQTMLLLDALRTIVGPVSRFVVFCDVTGFLPSPLATAQETSAPDEFWTFSDEVLHRNGGRRKRKGSR
ncbi:MAG TPA: hypothetical protein VIE89_31015 [Candidatus Binatia bacterium]|jgi:hypothetical protein